MSAGSELEVAAEDLQPEGPARKRPRRDEDDLLCDWIDALAWLETAETTAQVRRLRELAAALDKEPVTRVGLEDAAQYFQVRRSERSAHGLLQGPRQLGEVRRDCMSALLRRCIEIR